MRGAAQQALYADLEECHRTKSQPNPIYFVISNLNNLLVYNYASAYKYQNLSNHIGPEL